MRSCAPRIIGIAGPSGSGKSTLARRLTIVLGGDVAILPIDAYYRDLAGRPAAERAGCNFDAPEAIESPLLRYHVRELAAGRAVDVPAYDFATHTRTAWTRRLRPGAWVIVEGLFALCWPDIRAAYAAAVFIDTADAVCLSRRMARDVRERGRTPESIMAQYSQVVRPMAEVHVLPTRERADIVVPGSASIEEAAELVRSRLCGSHHHGMHCA
jgi:uridine kinase